MASAKSPVDALAMENKTRPAKLAAKPQAPVFQIVIRKPGANPKKTAPRTKPQKRGKIFSKSRDTREDRGSRQMKTAHNPQTLFHICALLCL
jgi:hypothetical protein